MKKILIGILVFAVTCLWINVFAADSNQISRTHIDGQGIQKNTVNPEHLFALQNNAAKPTEQRIKLVDVVNTLNNEPPSALAVYLSDDFEDGDFTLNPTWTATSNGGGTGDEDWAIKGDPWTYGYGTVTHNGSGYFAGCDSDAGGALADEHLSTTFSTSGTGNLTLVFWLHFRAYYGDTEYFEVLIDGTQVALYMAASGYNPAAIQGYAIVNINDYNDGASHTLDMHYYADYGYVCAIDDVIIADTPPNDDCSYVIDLGSGLGSIAGSTTGATNDYGRDANGICWQDVQYSLNCAGPDVVYKWTVPADGAYDFDVCDADFDADLTIWEYTCPTEPVYPDDYICGCDNQCVDGTGDEYAAHLINVTLTEGQEILIVVDAYGATTNGDFTLTIAEYAAATGACCVDQVCVATTTSSECDDLGGNWYVDETCPDYVCPEDLMDCPVGSIYSQPPTGSWVITSDEAGLGRVFEDVQAYGEICDLHFWGIWMKPSDYTECTPAAADFNIMFCPDLDGVPDIANPNCVYTVTANTVYTGESFGSYAEIVRYDITLDPCCVLNQDLTWISVQHVNSADTTCSFWWHSYGDSEAGYSIDYYYDSDLGEWVFGAWDNDLSICLTGTAYDVTGACCDDFSGDCTDGVLWYDCSLDYRFGANTLCADLDPACLGQLGACCVDEECVATNYYAECIALDGDWYEGAICDTLSCPSYNWMKCSDTDVYGQPPVRPNETKTASTSALDEAYPIDYIVYDNFSGLTKTIGDIRWWGLMQYYGDDGWEVCSDSTMEYIIKFYPDISGIPDTAHPVCSFQIVPDTIIYTGHYINWRALYYFQVELPSLCHLKSGWVSIQSVSLNDCWFLWANSLTGDGTAYQSVDDTLGAIAYDRAFCLSEAKRYEYVPGDANMINGQWPPQVIGGDVTYLVNYFRSINNACMLDGFYAAADVNGDCLVIGSDVTKLVNYFRGITSLSHCPDYEPFWHSVSECPSTAPTGWPNCD